MNITTQPKSSVQIRCNLCGSSTYRVVYRCPQSASPLKGEAVSNYTISETHLEKPDQIVQCTRCDLVYAVPKGPLSGLLQDYVEMVDPDYVTEQEGRRAQARIILAKISKFKKQGKLLDIGSGPGIFLDEARKQGWRVTGLDLSGWAQQYGKEKFGVEIVLGDLSGAGFPEDSFDAVTLLDVIEHVKDPKETLERVHRILKDDGVLYISTPDIESFVSRILGARWWGINKYHLSYFSKKTLEKLFMAVGFKKLRYSSYPRIFSLRYWAKRLSPYPAFIHAPIDFLSRIGKLGDRLLKIELHDQIDVIALRPPNKCETGQPPLSHRQD